MADAVYGRQGLDPPGNNIGAPKHTCVDNTVYVEQPSSKPTPSSLQRPRAQWPLAAIIAEPFHRNPAGELRLWARSHTEQRTHYCKPKAHQHKLCFVTPCLRATHFDHRVAASPRPWRPAIATVGAEMRLGAHLSGARPSQGKGP